MAKHFQFPFAENGNKVAVPDTTVGSEVSYEFGYSPAYELPKTNPDRRNIDRQPFNGVLYDVTANIKEWQEQAFPEIVADDGSGNPVSYPIGFIGRYSGVYYQAVVDGTTTVPPSADWLIYNGVNAGVSSRIGAEVAGTINVSAIIDNNPEFILPITPELGPFVTLAGHGAANFTITGFGDACPIGYVFTLLIPRTIANTGGPTNSLGNYVQFNHASSGSGIDMSINQRQSGASSLFTYQAYPNATSRSGDKASLYEKLSFIHIGSGRWVLNSMPVNMRSSNSFGEFVRSANGDQQTTASIVDTDVAITSAAGNVWRTSLITKNFPVDFSSAPVASIFGNAGSGQYVWFSRNSAPAIDSISYNVIAASSTTANVRSDISASGRWKPNI